MQRIATTVLCLAGPPGSDLAAIAAALGRGGNVRTVVPAPALPPQERAVEAWGDAARTHTPYFVHDADPLADVAAAWVDRWDGAGDIGRLEVAAQALVQRWRTRAVELPDYYLLVDADELSPTARHWYLGFLAGVAPHRVVLAGTDAAAALAALRSLRAGRWWPDMDVLLRDVERRVPDTLQLGEPATGIVV